MDLRQENSCKINGGLVFCLFQDVLHNGGFPGGAHVEDLFHGTTEHLDEEVGVVLVLHRFQLIGHLFPVVVGVEQGDEIVEVEVFHHHVVDAVGLDARMGPGQLYLAYLLQYLLVFLV